MLEYKALQFEVKEINDAGEFKGYASTRKKDSYGDIVAEGAFKRTIEQTGGKVPVLWFHDPTQPIGMSTLLKEDGHGLYTEGQIDLDIELGKRIYSGMKKGYIDRMSIGYRTIDDEWDPEQDARILKEVELLEYSLITRNFAANDEALLTGVKSLPTMLKQVTGLKQVEVDPELIRQAIQSLQALLQKSEPQPPTTFNINIQSADVDESQLRKLINEMKSYVRGDFA